MQNKICVYAICKNESQFVDRWYESMKEADSVVVLDTGSTDDTVEKLRSHGVTVEVKEINPWRFDVARNESLKLVPDDCNILVCTDLDEVFEKGWADKIRNKWDASKHTRAQLNMVWSHNEDGSDGRIYIHNRIHDKNWIWKYPVHEILYNKKTESERCPREMHLDLTDCVRLHHYPDRTKSRSSYLPLLKLRVKEYPNDTFGKIYLMHEYHYHYMEDECIELANEIVDKYKDELSSLELASCYLFMGDAYINKKDNLNAKACYQKAIESDRTYREPYLNIAKIYIEEKSYVIAIAFIKTAIKESYRHYSWLEKDYSWSYEPYDLLSLAYYYSGEKIVSLGYAVMASNMDKTNQRLKDNVDIIIKNISSTDI